MLTIDDVKNMLKKAYGDAVVKFEQPLPTRLFVDIKREKVRDISREIITIGGRYLVSVGYDAIAR